MKTTKSINEALMLNYVSRVVARRVELGCVNDAKGIATSELPSRPSSRATKLNAARRKSLKAKIKNPLSSHDVEEIHGACAVALMEGGSFQSGIVDWQSCFSGARAAVGMNHDSKTITDPTDPAELPQSWGGEHPDVKQATRKCTARRLHHLRQMIFAAYRADSGRQRNFLLRNTLKDLRTIHRARKGEISSRTTEGQNLKKKNLRLRAYCQEGEKALNHEAENEAKIRTRARRLSSHATISDAFKFATS